MNKISIKLVILIFFSWTLFLSDNVCATVLSWSGAWTGGQATAGSSDGPPPTAGPTVSERFSIAGSGVDVIVSVTQYGTGTPYNGNYTGVPGTSPQISTALNAGQTGLNTLLIGMDKQTTTADYVKVNVSFVNAGTSTPVAVSNVNTNLYDIDYSNATNYYQDKISNILGTTLTGGTAGLASITLGGSNGTANMLVGGTGTASVIQGNSAVSIGGGGANNDSSNNGNAAISYGTQAITGFSFQYSNGSITAGQSAIQFISMGTINFTTAPEMNPGFAAALACVGVMVFRRFRSRRTQVFH